MRLFAELIKNGQIKGELFMEFGFGTVTVTEAEKWIKETYPETYYEIEKSLTSTQVAEIVEKLK